MTTAVILPPTAASLLPVAGLPVVQRAALSALRAGCDSVVILERERAPELRAMLQRHPLTRSVRVVAESDINQAEDGQVLILPPDYVITPEAVRGVLETRMDSNAVVFELPEAARDGRVVVLCGADAVVRIVPGMMQARAGEGIKELTQTFRQSLRVLRMSDQCWPIRGAADVAAAEKGLIRNLRAATLETDGPIARLDRSLSTWISRRLVRTPLGPNHITTIGTLLGLLGAWCFHYGGYVWSVFGAWLFWVAVILDGCDGEVARLKFQETRYGGLYDVVTDNIVHAAIFLGLGVGHFGSSSSAHLGRFLTLLLGGFLCALLATCFCLLPYPSVRRLQPRSWRGRVRRRLLLGFESLMNRDFAYLLLLLAALDRLGWFLWGSLVGTYVYAVGLLWVHRWRDAE